VQTDDFVFAWEGAASPPGPWSHLTVVSFRGHEAISELFRYDLILRADASAPEVDVRELAGARATLRIATLSSPAYRLVHGVIAEAEELHATEQGMVFRVTLVPPLARALHRVRCRIFLDRTVRQIVDEVLAGEPALTRADGAAAPDADDDLAAFTPAAEQYAWRVARSVRVDRPGVRPFCVQYCESDFAFLARILEEEGIAFHYEHGEGTCLLVLSDSDAGRPSLGAPIGPGIPGREVTSMRLGSRVRPRAVALGDYDWKNPALDVVAEAGIEKGRGALVEQVWPGGFSDADTLGAPLAQRLAERYDVEASFAAGEGYARTLFAGALAAVRHPKSRYEGEVLITRIEAIGEQRGVGHAAGAAADAGRPPFEVRFECVQKDHGADSRFRPARQTPRPRILSSQTAVVTAEPAAAGALVNVGDHIGCVRLRFHWDRDHERLAREPSSSWVRVSQIFAGAGMGAVFHPRVGDEVVVEFLDGDPDRPIVTGRVYNAARTPPGAGTGSATASRLKSFSHAGSGDYNEIAFEDAAGAEELSLHAARDLSTTAQRNRSDQVRADARSSVGGARTESTGADRDVVIAANNSERVGAAESVRVGAGRSLLVGLDQRTQIGRDHLVEVHGRAETVVHDALTLRAGGAVAVEGATIVVKGGTVELDCDVLKLKRRTQVLFDDAPAAIPGEGEVEGSGA
jgi:type VI secretion system secreted protein VgrG